MRSFGAAAEAKPGRLQTRGFRVYFAVAHKLANLDPLAAVLAFEHDFHGVPHKAHALIYRAFGVVGRNVGKGHHSHDDNYPQDNQRRHCVFAEQLDSARHSPVNQPEIQAERNRQKHENLVLPEHQRAAVFRRADEVREKSARLRQRFERQIPAQKIRGIAQAPCLDVNIIAIDKNCHNGAAQPDIRQRALFGKRAHDSRGRIEAARAAVPADGPFRNGNRKPDEKERNDVRNHERRAAVHGDLTGEFQKIAQPHRASRDGQNHAEARAPIFALHSEAPVSLPSTSRTMRSAMSRMRLSWVTSTTVTPKSFAIFLMISTTSRPLF